MTESANDRLSFISIINFLLRNVAFLLGAGLVMAALLAIKSATAPRTYTTITSFMMGGEAPGRNISIMGVSLSSSGGRSPEFYTELIKTPAILGPLVETKFEVEPGEPPRTLIEHYGGSRQWSQAAKNSAMGTLTGMTSSKISTNGIITLRVTAENPALSTAIARAYLKEIEDFDNTKRKLQTSAERRFAEQRLLEIRADVRVAEARLQDFLERNREGTRSPAYQLERERIADEVGTRRALYSSVLQAYERAKMDEIRESPVATIITPPTVPTGPDPRSTTRNAILGFFLGVLLAGFVALAKEYFQRIPSESSPEANEFTTLREKSFGRLRRPIGAVLSAVRRPRQSPTL